MAPYQPGAADHLNGFQKTQLQTDKNEKEDKYIYKVQYVWRNIIIFTYLHLGALYGFYLLFTGRLMLLTFLFEFFYGWAAGTGITAGTHRLWAHKAYKARWPLRVFLAYFQAAAFQNHIYEWVRDHRGHHKFCDTNADPHNSKRGFFFSHVGWLLVRKHKDVMEKGKTVDMSDLERDWVVMFQKKYYSVIMPLCCFVIPTVVPWYFWGEDIGYSYWLCIARYVFGLNATWLVNSAAHMWGDKPYDQNLSASNNLFVGIAAVGEGWHNYHHAFPWDYKASEHWNINSTTRFINFFAKIGWAYDLKEASDDMIKKRALRTGDGSEVLALGKEGNITRKPTKEINHHAGEVWGYDDKDMTQEEKDMIIITNKKTK